MFGVLAVAERNEPEVAELFFELVRDDDVGRALGGNPLLVGAEGVDRQSRHQAAAVEPPLHPADIRQPARLGEGADQHAGHRVGRASPKIFALVRPGDIFLKAEPVHPGSVVLVRESHQSAGKRQADKAGVLRLAEGPPLQVVELVEGPSMIQPVLEPLEVVQAEHRGTNVGDEGTERGSCDVREGLENAEVIVGMTRGGARLDLEVSDQGGKGLAAGRAELLLVDLLEELTLVELDRPLKVPLQLLPRCIEHSDLDALLGLLVGPLGQERQSAPRCFQPLERWVVEDRIDLLVEQAVNVGHVLVQAADELLLVDRLGAAEPQEEGLVIRGLAEKLVQARSGGGRLFPRRRQDVLDQPLVRGRRLRQDDGRRQRPGLIFHKGVGARCSCVHRQSPLPASSGGREARVNCQSSGFAPPCAATWSVPRAATTAASRRWHCTSRAARGFP